MFHIVPASLNQSNVIWLTSHFVIRRPDSTICPRFLQQVMVIKALFPPTTSLFGMLERSRIEAACIGGTMLKVDATSYCLYVSLQESSINTTDTHTL